MGQPVGELAVVGQQDQAGRVGVEPTDRVQAEPLGHQPDHGGPSLGIDRGRYHSRRLVHRIHDPLPAILNELAVKRHDVRRRDVAGRVRDSGSPNGHPPRAHDLLGCSSRRDPRNR